MALMRIRLEHARSKLFPEGSGHHGYEFVLPLRADGRLDEAAFAAAPELATVHRFWEGEGDDVGQVVRTESGYAFSFAAGEDDDEPIARLPDHVFAENEYISVRERDGEMHTFTVVLLRPVPLNT